MKVCIFAVCYNSYKESLVFLNSISTSIKNTNIELDLFYIDNSSKVNLESIKLIKSYNCEFKLNYIKSENLGYFPSITSVINKNAIILSKYDYTIVSNVDLAVSNSFFSTLEDIPIVSDIGVYAPSIYSNALNADKNPKIHKRPSLLKLKLNNYLFSSSVTYLLLKFVNSTRVRFRQLLKYIPQESSNIEKLTFSRIYAAHGSLIIFTNAFLRKNTDFSYPIFLFGEEIYVAEEAEKYNLRVIYYPNLLVYDSEHVSTSTIKLKNYRDLNRKALSYLLQNYKFY
jgi:hypothetical protein